MDEEDLLDRIWEILEEQKFGVLATEYEGQPYSSLLAFAAAEDMETIVFATDRSTRKYANLASNPKVSFLVDNRKEDVYEASAVTAMGEAAEVSGRRRDELAETYLEKHPFLSGFLSEKNAALIEMKVESYVLNEGFRKVSSIEMR